MTKATIEQLQKIVANENRPGRERKEAAELILKLQHQDAQLGIEASEIANDDPEVLDLLQPYPDADVESVVSQYAIRTLPEAKRHVAWKRRTANLASIIGEETRPMDERVEAAHEWRPSHGYWTQFCGVDVVEKLTPHPHQQRLRELHDFIYFKDERGNVLHDGVVDDVDEYVKARLAAIAEFRSLFGEYPKRRKSTPILIDPEQYVAYMAKKSDPGHGVSRDTYSHVLRLAGWSV